MQSDVLEGAVIGGRYRVDRRVGEGGVAQVYRAEDLQRQQRVALKVIRHEVYEGSARLLREIKLSEEVVHPSIVRVIDYGNTESGAAYLVLEWVEGETLAELLDRERQLPWQRAAEIGAQLADALSVAHSAGVLHRDIKPSNVLLDTTVPGAPLAKLTDFGALGELLTRHRGERRLTMTGLIIGTPVYMSPEQLTGQAHSTATDVYGLALLMKEMIFGRDASPSSAQLLFAQRLSEDVVLPATPKIPRTLRTLLVRMLRREQERRPQSAAEVRDALRAMSGSRKESAPGAASSTNAVLASAAPWSRRQPIGLGAWSIGLGAAAVASFALAAIVRGTHGAGSVADAVPGIAIGVALITVGVLAGAALTRALTRRRSALEGDTGKLLLGTKDRSALTRTLVVELEVLIERVKEIDARILGITVVQMIREYETAKASPDRQAALMNATKLLKQFMEHLSPWYVRHAKVVGFAVSVIGAVSGVVKIMEGVMKIAR